MTYISIKREHVSNNYVTVVKNPCDITETMVIRGHSKADVRAKVARQIAAWRRKAYVKTTLPPVEADHDND